MDKSACTIVPFGNESLFLHAINHYIMGRGDKKTAKGKRFKGSFGKSRPAKAKKKAAPKKGK
jgi:30S ribosomal protein S31